MGEEEFKKQTVGLVSAEEFRAKRRAIDEIIQNANNAGKDGRVRLKRKVQGNKLSFEDDDMDPSESNSEEDDDKPARKHFGKDPSVNTSFLYDADREAEM